MLVLCAVFFLLPFSLRGARMAVESMKNDVSDWLPKTYEETKDLDRFRQNFVGDQFVLVSWPGCSEDDWKYQRFMAKLKAECADDQTLRSKPSDPDELRLFEEEVRAHEKGDELGLHTTGNYHEDWGNHREKWLMGKNGQWYFINQFGELYKWDGQNNLFDAISRSTERFFQGRNKATGSFIAQYGERPKNDGEVNPFYADPSKLFARFFKRVTSGPESLELMQTVLKTGNYSEDDAATFEATIEAHTRLEGWLFGPTPTPEFNWTFDSLLEVVPEDKAEQLQAGDQRREEFNLFVQQIRQTHGDDFQAKLAENPKLRLEVWYELWNRLQLKAPARQTCVLVYLNEPVLDELSRSVGRPLLGKTRGRILELASGQCGVDPESLHIGGPPADNVAIDEEGTITLLKLVSLSALIGIGLAYLSFRSFRVTIMLFFTGGVAAMSSLAFVHYAGSTMDAILMSMPSLVYVLGLSGAVHIVNYYRDACHESGEDGAAEKAIRLGWFPCTLAAFTTGLGLISLYTSYLTPIKKFGLFSAIATMATVLFLFSYLPASLHIWRPGYKKKSGKEKGTDSKVAIAVARMWRRVGEIVIRNHAVVSTVGIAILILFGYGITRIETSVQLLKLFDKDAKILQDYRWFEKNIGRLVPMEVVLEVDSDAIDMTQLATAKRLADEKRIEEENKKKGITPAEDQVAKTFTHILGHFIGQAVAAIEHR